MTGYHISVGYNSAHNKAEAWTTLKGVVARMREETDLIVTEVMLEQHAIMFRKEQVREYAEMYRTPALDATITIREPDSDRDGEIMQLASGGGDSREIKERVRRAFCRLVIFEMHSRGIEVNLTVA